MQDLVYEISGKINEGISILENWASMGLPLPKKIFDVLEQVKNEKGGGDDGKGTN